MHMYTFPNARVVNSVIPPPSENIGSETEVREGSVSGLTHSTTVYPFARASLGGVNVHVPLEYKPPFTLSSATDPDNMSAPGLPVFCSAVASVSDALVPPMYRSYAAEDGYGIVCAHAEDTHSSAAAARATPRGIIDSSPRASRYIV